MKDIKECIDEYLDILEGDEKQNFSKKLSNPDFFKKVGEIIKKIACFLAINQTLSDTLDKKDKIHICQKLISNLARQNSNILKMSIFYLGNFEQQDLINQVLAIKENKKIRNGSNNQKQNLFINLKL